MNLYKEEIHFLKSTLLESQEQVEYFKMDGAELNSIKISLTE
jgi:hypothetical protein